MFAKNRLTNSHHPDPLGNGGRPDLQRRGRGDISAELRAEFGHVVGEERGFMARAGNRDIAESRIEQVRVDAGIPIPRPRGGTLWCARR
jgi:hypothetical protein